MEPPRNPIAAVTHPDPYPYYAGLVARTPLYRDEALGLWVATSAEAVTAVLTSSLCRVRPPAEPVPRHLLGTPVGDIFRHLVRMNDGARYCPVKHAVSATLAGVNAEQIARLGSARARALADELGPATAPGHLMDFAYRLPADVVASLLGLPDDRLPAVAAWTGDLAACFAPGADSARTARGIAAASELRATFRALLADGRAACAGGLLAGFAREAGHDDADVIVANAIGFLTQAYEATAGLIGNTLVALVMRPRLRERAATDPRLLPAIVREVLRHDSPIQNTRRFLAMDSAIAGRALRAGDAILVVLAAANRDPAVNPDPARFDAARKRPWSFAFGAGAHACPGSALAVAIAAAGVTQLLLTGLAPARLEGAIAYRASPNARIPVFAADDH